MLTTALAAAAATWAILMALGPILQIRSIVRRRSSHGVSAAYFGVLLVGFALWVAYGVASGSLALVVPNAVAFVTAFATVVVALRYRRRERGLSPSRRRLPTKSGTMGFRATERRRRSQGAP